MQNSTHPIAFFSSHVSCKYDLNMYLVASQMIHTYYVYKVYHALSVSPISNSYQQWTIVIYIHSSKNKLLMYVQGNFCILYYFNFNCFTNINISAKNIYLSTYIVLATVSKWTNPVYVCTILKLYILSNDGLSLSIRSPGRYGFAKLILGRPIHIQASAFIAQ